jgi:hypothetical protein
LRAGLPAEVGTAEIRNRNRQVRDYVKAHGRLPADLVELEGQPRVAAEALLAAADCQLVTVERAGDAKAVLRWHRRLVKISTSLACDRNGRVGSVSGPVTESIWGAKYGCGAGCGQVTMTA